MLFPSNVLRGEKPGTVPIRNRVAPTATARKIHATRALSRAPLCRTTSGVHGAWYPSPCSAICEHGAYSQEGHPHRNGPKNPSDKRLSCAPSLPHLPILRPRCSAYVGRGTVSKTPQGRPHGNGPQNPCDMSSGARLCAVPSHLYPWCLIRWLKGSAM